MAGGSLAAFDAKPETERELWIARHEREAETCPQHGGPLSECHDADALWYPQRSVCHATMERLAAEAKYRELHDKAPFHDGTFEDWSATRSASHPYHFTDGVTIWTSRTDHSPDDDFLRAPGRTTDDEGGD